MNKLTLSVFLTLSIHPISFLGAAQSAIRQVEVYPSGAAITRTVTLDPSGENTQQVRIENLPSSLVASSIRISPVGHNTLRTGSFTYSPNENPVKADDPRTQDLRDKVEELDAALRDLRLEQEMIQARINHYEGLAYAIKDSLKKEAKQESYELATRAWESLEEIRKTGQVRLAELEKKQQALQIDRREAQKDLDEKMQELGKISGVLEFDVAGNLSDGAQLELAYQVPEAGWNPVYEIRALPAEKSLRWVYKARIWQQSGENWEDVNVALNSSTALHSGDLPELPPLYLQRRQMKPMPRQRAEDEVVELSPFEVSVEDASKGYAAPAAMAGTMATPESTTARFYIELPQPLTLPSGEEPVIREAFAKSLEAEFWSQAVPELSMEAWLMAGTTNNLGWPILSGEAYAYIDQQLVSRKFLRAIGAGEEIELALGKNEKIAIERNELLRRQGEIGLVGKKNRHEIKYETRVTNNMSVPHEVVLKDRFPVSRNEEIEVKRVRPQGVEPEEGKGIFEWRRELAPGEEATMVTEYTVTYPVDWILYPPL